MKKFARLVLTAALVAVIAAPLMAADKKKKKKKNKGPKKARVVQLIRFKKDVQASLTADQKKQIQAINAEYAPKLAEILKKQRELVTPEKQKAAREAMLAARKAGKKGKELRAAYDEALGLSEEQKKQRTELVRQSLTIRKEAYQKAVSLLTDDQKAKLSPVRKKGKKKGRKKNAAK